MVTSLGHLKGGCLARYTLASSVLIKCPFDRKEFNSYGSEGSMRVRRFDPCENFVVGIKNGCWASACYYIQVVLTVGFHGRLHCSNPEDCTASSNSFGTMQLCIRFNRSTPVLGLNKIHCIRTFAPVAIAHLYCARYSLSTHVPRHFQARTESKTQQNIELMTLTLTWCTNILSDAR